jgi:hypothetical protein
MKLISMAMLSFEGSSSLLDVEWSLIAFISLVLDSSHTPSLGIFFSLQLLD